MTNNGHFSAELPEGNGGRSGTTPVQSPRSSFSGPGAAGGTGGAGPSSTSHVRPPSPILPRRKSSGPGLRGGIPPSSSAAGGPRRLSWRRESGDLASDPSDPRKKSLTWYGETTERISVAQEKRRASRQSFDAGLGPNETNNPDRYAYTILDLWIENVSSGRVDGKKKPSWFLLC